MHLAHVSPFKACWLVVMAATVLRFPASEATPTPAPTFCIDTDNGAADPYGDPCSDYAIYTSWCGNYDDDDFTSNEMCCGCNGGMGSATALPTPTPTSPAPTLPCYDTNAGAVSAYNYYGCDDSDGGATYGAVPSYCPTYYNDADFSPADMCCHCGGGTTDASAVPDPNPSPSPTQATFDWGCTNSANGRTGMYGYTCAYWGFTSYPNYYCASYDDDDFTANDMCCVCSAPTQSPTSPAPTTSTPPPTVPCFDTSNGAVDPYSDGCDDYQMYPSWCGDGTYDDDDFSHDDMCCACGGGTIVEPEPVVLAMSLTASVDCDNCALIIARAHLGAQG